MTESSSHRYQQHHRSGDVIADRYRIIEQIGHGGSSRIYEALDLELEIRVALKHIQTSLLLNEAPEQIERVKREARALRDLSPLTKHIVECRAVVQVDQDLYIELELLRGESLDVRQFQVNTFDAKTTCTIARQLCEALRLVHHMGFIHRDIKPENIYLTRGAFDEEHVKLLDFGLVKSPDDMTMTQGILGTTRYQSPEQAIGKSLQPATDIYSLGLVLYRMLTGRSALPPERQQIAIAYANGIQNIRSALADVDVPTWLIDVIEQCLQCDPNQRPTSAALHQAFVTEGRSLSASAPPPIADFITEVLEDEEIDALEIADDDLLDVETFAASAMEAEPVVSAPSTPLLDPKPSTPPPLLVSSAEPTPQVSKTVEAIAEPKPATAPIPKPATPTPSEPVAPPQPAPKPADQALPLDLTGPSPTYHSIGAAPTKKSVAMPIAVFLGMLAISAAILYQKQTPAIDKAPISHAPAAPPSLKFRPHGPVDEGDFPKSPTSSAAAVSAAPQTVAKIAPSSAAAAPQTQSAASPVSVAKAVKPLRRARRKGPRPVKHGARKGPASTFRRLAGAAEARGEAALDPSATASRRPLPGGPLEFEDDDESHIVLGSDLIKDKAQTTHSSSLPINTRFSAVLTTGLSTAGERTALARLKSDVEVDGKLVLAKGSVISGKLTKAGANRIFIIFTRAKGPGGTPVKFKGKASVGGDEGLPAKRKKVDSNERGTNVLARAALRTGGTVAGAVGGAGVAGELAENIAREGAGEVRGDFRSQMPYILTVKEGTAFTVTVIGEG